MGLPQIIHVDEMDQFPGAVYIGRQSPRRGLRRSPLHNPYRIGPSLPRDEAVQRFRSYAMGSSAVLLAISDVRDAPALACWCRHANGEPTAKNLCHGDAILAILSAMSDDDLNDLASDLISQA